MPICDSFYSTNINEEQNKVIIMLYCHPASGYCLIRNGFVRDHSTVKNVLHDSYISELEKQAILYVPIDIRTTAVSEGSDMSK